MIARMHSSEHTPAWKKIFADGYVGSAELKLLRLNINQDDLEDINAFFPVQLTQTLLDQHPVDGSVLRQYLPDAQELIHPEGYGADPVGDVHATQQSGVIKKYNNRVLLITTHNCPIHCRYCFRKEYPYKKDNPNTHQFKNALDFIASDISINEVILSGGDPLSLEDEVLANLFYSIEKIPHIKTLRLHTKYPSIIPQRITSDFLNALENCQLNTVCVFHINHPNEISDDFCAVSQILINVFFFFIIMMKSINFCHKNTLDFDVKKELKKTETPIHTFKTVCMPK